MLAHEYNNIHTYIYIVSVSMKMVVDDVILKVYGCSM